MLGVPGGAGGMGMGKAGVGGMPSGDPMSAWSGPPRMAEIIDGTSNTILIVEANDAVVWTKPDDVVYDIRKPIPALGGQFEHVFHVAMGDGSVRSIPKRCDPKTLRAAINPADGENFDHSKLDGLARGAVSAVRQQALDRLERRNTELKIEASILNEILQEVRYELDEIRWTIEQDKLLELDPKAKAIMRENAELEKSLRESREQARTLIEELRRLREQVKPARP